MAWYCYRCNEKIKGEVLHHDPPLFAIRLGTDFKKAFHPSCYKEEEEEAKLLLAYGPK